jgi:hypothetical protein
MRKEEGRHEAFNEMKETREAERKACEEKVMAEWEAN